MSKRRTIKRRISDPWIQRENEYSQGLHLLLTDHRNNNKRETRMFLEEWDAIQLHDILQAYFKQRGNMYQRQANNMADRITDG